MGTLEQPEMGRAFEGSTCLGLRYSLEWEDCVIDCGEYNTVNTLLSGPGNARGISIMGNNLEWESVS